MKTGLHTGERTVFVKHNKSGFLSNTVLCNMPLSSNGKLYDNWESGSLYITNQRIIFEAGEKSRIASLGNIDSFIFTASHDAVAGFEALEDDGTLHKVRLSDTGDRSAKEARVHLEGLLPKVRIQKAKQCEEHLDYKRAIEIYDKIGKPEEAARVRKIVAEQKKVDQTVVQGDQVTKTEIKDSVLNRSNVGGGSSKMQELKDLTEMKEKGLIDDDEFKQMKKEILGK